MFKKLLIVPLAMLLVVLSCQGEGCLTGDLVQAVREGNISRIKNLLKLTSPDARDKYGRTALAYADDPKVVQILIANGANINCREALLMASARGNIEVIEILVKAGANVNTTDWYHFSALMYAVICVQPEAVKFLINAGANVKAKTGDLFFHPRESKRYRIGERTQVSFTARFLCDYEWVRKFMCKYTPSFEFETFYFPLHFWNKSRPLTSSEIDASKIIEQLLIDAEKV